MKTKQKERIKAIELLKENKLFNLSFQIYWNYLREQIFTYLSDRNIAYKSTEEALLKFYTFSSDETVFNNLYSIYILAMTIEWDVSFKITEEDFTYFEPQFINISNQFL